MQLNQLVLGAPWRVRQLVQAKKVNGQMTSRLQNQPRLCQLIQVPLFSSSRLSCSAPTYP